jgi:hypothetical protein
MLYFTETAEGSVTVASERTEGAQSRWDWNSKSQVNDLAARANAAAGKDLYIGIDRGEWTSPRFDIMGRPQIGDDVSYAFNGDSYPCGQIAKISDSLKVITTTTGRRFYRRRETGSWVNGGTWSLVQGHHNERNPHF